MKKTKWGTALAALTLILFAASCSSSSGGGSDNDNNNDDETTTQTQPETQTETQPETQAGEVIPAGFVKVIGATVTGGNKFAREGTSADQYKGVFREDRSVTIANFYMCDHEVTQAEYQAVMGNNPSSFDNAGNGETPSNRPVESVNWYEAIVYCNKKSIADGLQPCYTINGKTNPTEWGTIPTDYNDAVWDAVTCDFTKNGYRLPTEAEWEYAARGGKAGCEAADPDDWAGTDDSTNLRAYAWINTNSYFSTHEVKTKTANSLNLFDMTGNVCEWCWDWCDVYNTPSITATTPATGVGAGTHRAFRGGGWDDSISIPYRNYNGSPYVVWSTIGFRVVRTAN